MNVGVIGTGNMGENHLRTYATLRNHCTLVGVYDVDQLKCADAANRYGAVAYNSLDALLDDVDAVSITVPTPFHYEVGMACIRKGVHVLMEKPIAATELEAIALKKCCK
ncbi:Gfo/Idh/MocA family protein [Geomicrobium sp. JCM 19055]|uniref:Gfo/Idh/MocA family protein n=1 Tax=Geomicrobium sp. JCM 19055 TaxID=1460649 RepID=UPI00045ED10E|nr:Gfo/Idh/MocA family oxidoreductase [Geomicrobium sp. JCM 19055]GAJ98405.1 probable oxidoreductase [Geomicrobium sp. JCM 19055]